MSARIACTAASLRISGQGKLGKPCARLMASCSVASRVIPRITDSVNERVRAAVRGDARSRAVTELVGPVKVVISITRDRRHIEHAGPRRDNSITPCSGALLHTIPVRWVTAPPSPRRDDGSAPDPCGSQKLPPGDNSFIEESMFGSPSRWRVVLSLVTLSIVASCDRDQSPTAPAASPALSLATVGFSLTGDMVAGRSDHIALRLLDGRVLVAGGRSDGRTGLATAELYDPATGTWAATGSMTTGRFAHTAVLLADGRVLVMGGVPFNSSCADPPTATSAELYNPATSTWTRTGNLAFGRASAVAVVLADGRVLVTGGGRCGVIRNQSEIFDPATGTWTTTGSMSVVRRSPAAVRLADGRVLVAGAPGAFPFPSLTSAEIYDPASGAWTTTGAMHDPRVWTSDDESAANFLMPLADGRIFTAGGLNRCSESGCDLAFLASAEIFDPASGSWSVTGAMATGRYRHQLALLPTGQVLAAGGRSGGAVLGSAEVFDPATGTFSGGGSLATARQDYPATALGDGRVLLSGGQGVAGALRSAELYTSDRPPVASAGPSLTGSEGTAVQFDGTGSSDPDGDSLTFAWTFGDGSSGSGPAPSHVYADDGTYAVTLLVSDGSLTASAATTA